MTTTGRLRPIITLGVSAVLLLWTGCEDGERILTISYNDEYQPSDAENFLIIHSNKGKVLATKSFGSVADLDWDWGKDASDSPGKITLTIVKPYYTSAGDVQSVYLSSFRNVDPAAINYGRERRADGSELNLSFSNPPDHNSYWIRGAGSQQCGSGNLSAHTLTPDLSPSSVLVTFGSSEDCHSSWISTHWFEGLQAGSHTLDLSSEPVSMATAHITLDSPEEVSSGNIMIGVDGYPNGDEPDEYYELNDYWYQKPASTTTLEFQYPESIFEQYILFARWDETGGAWRAIYSGSSMPDNLAATDGELSIVESSPGDFRFETTGSFDLVYSYWRFEAGEESPYQSWRVIGSASDDKYSLPDLPPEVKKALNLKNPDSYSYHTITAVDYRDFDSYNAYMEGFFDPWTTERWKKTMNRWTRSKWVENAVSAGEVARDRRMDRFDHPIMDNVRPWRDFR